MEDLNKTQVVLLTLFITFVTSVTTGIITVTLLDQSPPGVTQTINRVIEKVIPGNTQVQVKETRVILPEEEALQVAIKSAGPSLVRILAEGSIDTGVSSAAATASTSNEAALILSSDISQGATEIGTGFVVAQDGEVATSQSLVNDSSQSYSVVLNKKKYSASLVTTDQSLGFSLLRIDNKSNLKFLPPPFSLTPLVLGQTVFVLGNSLDHTTASVGIVNSVGYSSELTTSSYKTNLKSDDTNVGGPILDNDGNVVGINLSSGGVLPIKLLSDYLASSTPAKAAGTR